MTESESDLLPKSNGGRKKIDVTERIEDPKKRGVTLTKRKKTLFNQVQALYDMCGMSAFVITKTEVGKTQITGLGDFSDFKDFSLEEAQRQCPQIGKKLTIKDIATLYASKSEEQREEYAEESNRSSTKKKRKRKRSELEHGESHHHHKKKKSHKKTSKSHNGHKAL